MSERRPDLSRNVERAASVLLDDTHRAWLRTGSGYWYWIDVAGYLENHGISEPHPRFEIHADGFTFGLLDRPGLDVDRVTRSVVEAEREGVRLLYGSQDPALWYRPLRIQRVRTVPVTVGLRTAFGLPLTLSAGTLQAAARANAAPYLPFVKRLVDLLGAVEPPVAEIRFQLKLGGERATPWNWIMGGHLGMVEQLLNPYFRFRRPG